MVNTATPPEWIQHPDLLAWIEDMATLCIPTDIHWCDGSDAEYDALCEQFVEAGTFIRLNPQKRPRSYLARSDASDVARVEERTYICARSEEDAGPTNNGSSRER